METCILSNLSPIPSSKIILYIIYQTLIYTHALIHIHIQNQDKSAIWPSTSLEISSPISRNIYWLFSVYNLHAVLNNISFGSEEFRNVG